MEWEGDAVRRFKMNWRLFWLGMAFEVAAAVVRIRAMGDRRPPWWFLVVRLLVMWIVQAMTIPLQAAAMRLIDRVVTALARWLKR